MAIDTNSSIILGIVEGVTEFLPISSTGHLIVAGHLLGVHGDKAASFEIFIQLGAILAVVFLYWRRFAGLAAFGSERESFKGWDGIWKLAVVTFPACVAGLLLGSQVKEFLFYPRPVALALFVGGVFLIWVEGRKRDNSIASIEEIPLRTCLLIGVCQCISLWPGISRSASTIVGGMLLGLNRKTAAEFSFLAAVPVMTLATIYDLYKSMQFLEGSDLQPFAIGFIVSFITAVLAVKFFLALLARTTLRVFGFYRILAALAVLMLL
ncbi:MAG: undecaprenyl-diphosphatase [Proteobacteria bacterium]|nr:MAG: undecaprenyl-diphosphatase [Pseudomonadota bacterium]